MLRVSYLVGPTAVRRLPASGQSRRPEIEPDSSARAFVNAILGQVKLVRTEIEIEKVPRCHIGSDAGDPYSSFKLRAPAARYFQRYLTASVRYVALSPHISIVLRTAKATPTRW